MIGADRKYSNFNNEYRFSPDDNSLIAFTSHLASDSITVALTAVASEPLPFASTSLNLGEHFSATTHKFTCPTNGVYEFFASIKYIPDASNAQNFSVSLVKNTDVLVTLQTATQQPQAELGRSKSVVVHCLQGDQVFVRFDTAISVVEFLVEKFSTFSGRLLSNVTRKRIITCLTSFDLHVHVRVHEFMVGFRGCFITCLDPLLNFTESFYGGSVRGYTDLSSWPTAPAPAFDTVIFDPDGQFNADYFICPVNGYYKFSLHYDLAAGDVGTLAIVKGLVLTSARAGSLDVATSASKSVIVECQENEEVSVPCILTSPCSHQETTIFTARPISGYPSKCWTSCKIL